MRPRGLKHVESFAACVIVEIIDYGDFACRYDFSRVADVSALSNAVVGAKFGTNVLGDVTALLGGTNTVTSICGHRLTEFDWDDDGLANTIDPQPLLSNGDCHGQGEGWVAACCAILSSLSPTKCCPPADRLYSLILI